MCRLHKIGKQNPNLGSTTDNGNEEGDSPDMTAIVSALANQQSEENLLNDNNDSTSLGAGSLDSLDVSNMQFVARDLHSIGKMFIQANLLPRPRSESNFQV